MCSIPETDDSLPGWVVGKAVAYCSNCCNNQSELNSKIDETYLEEIEKEDDEFFAHAKPKKVWKKGKLEHRQS